MKLFASPNPSPSSRPSPSSSTMIHQFLDRGGGLLGAACSSGVSLI